MFGNFFKSFGDNKGDSVLGIDIGAASIKVVQLRRRKGKAVLETYGELALGPYAGIEIGRATKLPAEKIVEALGDVLKEANVTTMDSALCIPMRSSMVSLIKMPEMERKQMEQMIPIEARKYIPVPISEVTLDWFVIPEISSAEDNKEKPEGEQNLVEILVVAIHNDVLNTYASIVTGSQLQASFFEIEMFSAIRATLEHGDNAPVMIFDMGAGATKLYIVERGIVRDSHMVNRGSQDITINISKAMNVSMDVAEKLKRNHGRNSEVQDQNIAKIADLVLSPLFSEANSVLLNYQRKYNKNVAKVIMVGGGVLLHGVIEQAGERFGIETVPGDPFSRVETPAFLQEVLKKTGFAFSGAIGLALRKLQEME